MTAQHCIIPFSQSPPDHNIQFIWQRLEFFLRDVKGGLAFRVYFSTIPPPRDTGFDDGDFYVLMDPATVFWRDKRWRPWIWKSFVKHPLWPEYTLNFDFQGPTWTLSSRPLEPSFLNSTEAIVSFFKVNPKCVSDLGSSLKPIVID